MRSDNPAARLIASRICSGVALHRAATVVASRGEQAEDHGSQAASSQQSPFSEREVAPVSDDDVIVHRKVEELSRLDQLPRNSSVIL